MARALGRVGPRRILISMPPRHGKSLLTSVYTPAWFLATWPHRRVILCSYEATIAQAWGRQVRNLLDENSAELGVELAAGSRSASRWQTAQGGGMLCAGVGGPITGQGADLMLIDDPVKNRQQANSVLDRNTKDDWYREVVRTRLEPGATVVIIQTRWHEDDLMGRRLMAMERGDEEWLHLNLPAIAETDDELGRKEGDALWSERYDAAELAQIRKEVGEYGWYALFQQRPQPAEGGIFKEGWFRQRYDTDRNGSLVLGGLPYTLPWSSFPRFVTIDPAIKERDLVETDAFSVICVWGVLQTGQLALLEVIRKRMSSPAMVREMQAVDRRWKPTAFWVEKPAIGTALIQWARENGLRCRELEADRDKATRAMGAAPSCEAGKVLLPVNAPWLGDFMHELLAAPTGVFWDQVDAFSYGVLVFDQHALESWPAWDGTDKTPHRDSDLPQDTYTDDPEDDDRDDWDGLAGGGSWRKIPW